MRKYICSILAAVLLMTGCSTFSTINEDAAVQAEAPVTESSEYPVTVGNLTFNSSPTRVASLSPAVTEIICELGFGSSIVCRGAYCDYPPEVTSADETGSSANPDIDAIIGHSPEVVITQSPIANKDIKALNDAGIAVLILPSPDNISELKQQYEDIASIFTGSEKGKELAASALIKLEGELSAARNSCENLVLIMDITEDGYASANGSSFAGNYISYFGSNIAALNESCLLTPQELLAADPQVIFLSYPLDYNSIDSETSELLSAYRNGYVYVIDGSLLERPTSRLDAFTASIASQLRNDTGGNSYSGGFAVIPDYNELEPAEDVN